MPVWRECKVAAGKWHGDAGKSAIALSRFEAIDTFAWISALSGGHQATWGSQLGWCNVG